MWRDRVVGIGDGDEVRNRLAPDVFGGRRPPARAREEVRLRDFTVVEDDLAGGRIDGGVRRRLLVLDPEVHLAARVGIQIERAGTPRRKRIRAGGDRLRLQCLGVPGVRHLRGDDAVEVLLEADHVDRTQLARGHVDLDRAAIAVLQRQRGAAGLEEQRPGKCAGFRLAVDSQLQRGCQRVGPGRKRVNDAAAVSHLEVRSRVDGECLDAARQQHSHARHGCVTELGAGEVVQHDLLVVEALLGVPVGTPLAQPDSVAPAVAGDDERRCALWNGLCGRTRMRRRTGDEQQHGDE